MAQVGRISGPLLTANLERNGIDLAFRNTLDTTQLLYLNVNNGYIGVNTGTPDNQLEINGTTQTTDLIADSANIDGLTFINNRIEGIGDILLNASDYVYFPKLDNGTLRINDNSIVSTISAADIDITPNGTGQVNINSNLNVVGDLSATGNVTLDGTINFGDASDDSTYPVDTVTFDTEIDSDIIPDQTGTYNLGTSQKRWNELWTNLVNGTAVNATSLTVGNIDFTLRQGNIFWVSQNGTDTNKGDHPQSPVASIRRALELADASNGGPVVIYVNAGDYEEETPLVVPSNVTIMGAEMRSVNVFPTSYTLSEDVFHLNGETTIQNITVRDFYFDDNKGYAFRFAPNAVISTRSPYIQNCTVITKGSNVTADDPRGFNSGDAGRGAYVDGAELNSSSVDASMLFHSVTFITPGVDGLTMTNGVRVEWLNSFTYFANRGLYAFNNSTGRILQDGSTVGYGAELRSIGSANVYGNYGAVADGSDTLMYLIQHNFGYVGSGSNSENDLGLVNQPNEVVEENSGKIYYSTTDQSGNFRVGDNFVVDFDTGGTSINSSSLTADALNGIIVTTGTDTTTVRGDRVETGNIRFTGSTVETLSGDLTIDSPLDINLLDNTNISNDLDITGDLSFDGNLNLLGNQATDTLKFNVDFDQDFSPNQTLAFDLGSPTKEWLIAHLSSLESGDISFYDNVIETNVSNTDLELRPNGTGKVYVPQSATFSNALTVNQTSNLQDVNMNGNLVFTGDLNLIGSAASSESLDIGENLTVGASAQFEELLVDDNIITTTSSNADLELRAAGTGDILIPDNDVSVSNNLTIQGDTFTSDIVSSQQISANKFTNGTYEITQNRIDTVLSNANLELRSTQNILFDDTVNINNDLTVQGITNLQNTNITGNVVHIGNTTQTGNTTLLGELTVDNIYIEDNFITTTTGNLTLEAAGTGDISISSNDVEIANNLTVSGSTSLQSTTITGTVTHVGNRNQTGNLDIAGEISNGNILIEDNFISTTNTNSDLELRASGTGEVVIDPTDSLTIENNLFVGGTLDYQGFLTINGDVTLQGNTQDGSLTVTENFSVTGILDVSSQAQFEDVRIEDNFITTTLSNSDLELRAAGTGSVRFAENVIVENNLSVNDINSGDINIVGDILLNEIDIPPSIVEINDNYISTKISNADLDLRASGTGIIEFVADSVIENDLSVLGNSTFNTDVSIMGNINQTGNNSINGNLTLDGNITVNQYTSNSKTDFEDISIDGNILKTTLSNSDLELRASGTGVVKINAITDISNNLAARDITAENLVIDDGLALEFLQSNTDIKIFDNVITTTNSNSDLELRAAGTGSVYLQSLEITGNTIGTEATPDSTLSDIVLDVTDNLNINSTAALSLPSGSTDTLSNAYLRFNTDDNLFEGYNGGVVSFNGVYSDDRLTSVTADPTSNTLRFIVGGAVDPLDSTNLISYIDGNAVYTAKMTVEDIEIDNNLIKTTASNADLELRASGTGEVTSGNFSIKSNLIKNNSTPLIFANTNFGYVKFSDKAGIALPSGNNTTDRPVANPPIGDTRWNTTETVLEVWDGSTYISAAGASSEITEEEFNDLLLEYTIILG